MKQSLNEGDYVNVRGPLFTIEGKISHVVELQDGMHYTVKIGDYVWIDAPVKLLTKKEFKPERVTDIFSDSYVN